MNDELINEYKEFIKGFFNNPKYADKVISEKNGAGIMINIQPREHLQCQYQAVLSLVANNEIPERFIASFIEGAASMREHTGCFFWESLFWKEKYEKEKAKNIVDEAIIKGMEGA